MPPRRLERGVGGAPLGGQVRRAGLPTCRRGGPLRVRAARLAVRLHRGLHGRRVDGAIHLKRDGSWSVLREGVSFDSLLRMSLDGLRGTLDAERPAVAVREGAVFGAPIESQEVWAAGVTYQRSLEARTD